MKKGAGLLLQSIGTIVEKVSAEILFYREENIGVIGNVLVVLHGGRTFYLGSAGDGLSLYRYPSSMKPERRPVS